MALPEWQGTRNESWRRIRVGVTGLGGIVLLIALASAMLEQLAPNQTPVAAAVSDARTKPAAPDSEPLAELGVAPGAPTNPAAADEAPPARK